MKKNIIDNDPKCNDCGVTRKCINCGKVHPCNICEKRLCAECRENCAYVRDFTSYMRNQAKEAVRIAEYVLFGIIIALFYYDSKGFIQDNILIVSVTFGFSVLCLCALVAYYFCQYSRGYDFTRFKYINDRYEKFRENSHWCFRIILFMCVIPVLLFLITTYLKFAG